MSDLATAAGVTQETSARLREVVEGFDRMRYTPGGGASGETQELIEGASRLITALEREWR
jgi:hypothetical protein